MMLETLFFVGGTIFMVVSLLFICPLLFYFLVNCGEARIENEKLRKEEARHFKKLTEEEWQAIEYSKHRKDHRKARIWY